MKQLVNAVINLEKTEMEIKELSKEYTEIIVQLKADDDKAESN